MRLLAHTPRSDFPDGFHIVAAQAVHAIVEIHGWVAVRDDELQAIPYIHRGRRLGHVQLAMLVATPCIADPGNTSSFRSEGLVGGESFEAAVDNRQIVGW